MEETTSDITTSLEYSFVEQCWLQIEKLRIELLGTKRTMSKKPSKHRLFRYNVFQDIEPRKKQYLEKVLYYALKSLGSHIHSNLLKAARDSRSTLLSTPTPIRDLSISSPTISRSHSCSSEVRFTRSRSNSNASEILVPVSEVIVISSDEEEEDELERPHIKEESTCSRGHSTPLRNITNSTRNLDQNSNISLDMSLDEELTSPNWPNNSVLSVSTDLVNFVYDSLGVIHLKSKEDLRYTTVKLAKQALYLHIIAKVLKLMDTGSYMTKRELYYLSLNFCRVKRVRPSTQTQSSSNSGTQTQRTCTQTFSQISAPATQEQSQINTIRYSTNKLDKALDDLCCLLGCSRVHLRILPQSKGIVYGNLKFKLKSGEVFDCLSKKEGINLPTPREPIISVQSDAKFIIVIEKDSVLQKILSQEEETHFVENYKAILLTAKGYPDLTSKAFLNFLWSKLKIPILALTDADPCGLEIVCSYKFGCYSTAYESLYLAVPHLRWLGLLPGDIMRLAIPASKTLAQTHYDTRKLKSLISRPYLKMKPDWVRQMNMMKVSGRKAELESLDNSGEYLVKTYLPNKLRYASWL